MTVSVDKREVEDVVVLTIRGRLGEVEAGVVQEAFLDVFNSGCYRVIADFSEVDFMTSSGLGVLMMSMKRTRERHGFMRIANPQPLIRDILQTTRLDRFLEIYPSVEAALAADSSGGS